MRIDRWAGVGAALAFASVATAQSTITLIHTNDLHARVESATSGGRELGGYARLATAISQLRDQATNPLVLDAGDVFQGTFYFNVYKGLADLAFMNYVGYQAMVIGNHEFDLGTAPLADFVDGADFPILSANLDLSDDERLRETVVPHVVLWAGEERVGIVGLTTDSIFDISSPGETVRLLDTVASVQESIDMLTDQGIDKIVLLSHQGWSQDLAIAPLLDDVDVILGGHSHTPLGDIPGVETMGDYPTTITDATGEEVLVAQAWSWGRVVGNLELTFDDEGKVIDVDASQKLVDESVPEDPVVASMVRAFRLPLEAAMEQVVADAPDGLERGDSYGGESPMGNLIADAMLAATQSAGSEIAMMNAGGIRAAIDAGPITYGEIIGVQPFNNTLVVLEITGAELLAALEHGVGGEGGRGTGGMLHISSGSSYTVDFSEPIGQRVFDVVVAGEALDLDRTYRVTLNNFTANGGDAHRVLEAAQGERIDTGLLDVDALIALMTSMGEVRATNEGRIVVR